MRRAQQRHRSRASHRRIRQSRRLASCSTQSQAAAHGPEPWYLLLIGGGQRDYAQACRAWGREAALERACLNIRFEAEHRHAGLPIESDLRPANTSGQRVLDGGGGGIAKHTEVAVGK